MNINLTALSGEVRPSSVPSPVAAKKNRASTFMKAGKALTAIASLVVILTAAGHSLAYASISSDAHGHSTHERDVHRDKSGSAKPDRAVRDRQLRRMEAIDPPLHQPSNAEIGKSLVKTSVNDIKSGKGPIYAGGHAVVGGILYDNTTTKQPVAGSNLGSAAGQTARPAARPRQGRSLILGML